MKAVALLLGGALVLAAGTGLAADADPARQAILDGYATAAGPGFDAFSASRGRALYMGPHNGGKPETPACATCHTGDPRGPGRHYRTGREIPPMAASATPDRFTDAAEVEKRFGRDCPAVLGRDCTALEKGDFITYLAGQ